MAYINGNQLNIFPVSNRTAKPYDNWLTEFNLSSIINQLVGNQDGFVITETVSADAPIEFNIGGYYFKVSSVSLIKEAVDNKNSIGSSFVTFEKDENGYYTASIKISKNTDNPTLLGSDSSDSSGDSFDTKTLKLFDASYKVPPESRLSLIVLNNLTVKGQAVVENLKVTGTLDAEALRALSLDDGVLPDPSSQLKSVDDGNLANPESIGKLIVNDGDLSSPGSLGGTGNIDDGSLAK